MKQFNLENDAEMLKLSIDNYWSQFILYSIQKYYDNNLHIDNEMLDAFRKLQITNECNVKEQLYQIYLDQLVQNIITTA